MCGYCIEGGVTLDFVESEKVFKEEDLENNLVSMYLLESEDVSGLICKLKKFDNFSSSTELVFYRIWEMLLFQESDSNHQALINELSPESINKFFANVRSNHKIWKPLGESQLYIDNAYWESFIDDKPQLISNATDVLKAYYECWLLGSDKKTNDLAWSVEETDSKTKFTLLFSEVYFAFLVLAKEKNLSVIQSIALKNAHKAPDFQAYDLWLQRKAFVLCVKIHGVQFIFDNYDDIRLELMYYLLLKNILCSADLNVLKEYLLLHEHQVNGFVDTESVLELINKLVNIKKA